MIVSVFNRGCLWRSINLLGLCQVQPGCQVWRSCSELLQSSQGCLHWGDQVSHVLLHEKKKPFGNKVITIGCKKCEYKHWILGVFAIKKNTKCFKNHRLTLRQHFFSVFFVFLFIFNFLVPYVQPCDDQGLRCALGDPGSLRETPRLWRERWGNS